MRQDFDRLFAALEREEPPANLAQKILSRVDAEISRRRAIWHSILLTAVSAISAVAAVFAWQTAGSELVSSGFTEFASLVFSDASTLAANWSSFLYAAAESFPVASVAALLASVGMFLASSRHLFRDARFVFTHRLTV